MGDFQLGREESLCTLEGWIYGSVLTKRFLFSLVTAKFRRAFFNMRYSSITGDCIGFSTVLGSFVD